MRRHAIQSSMMVLGPLLGTLLQATTVHAQWTISMRAMQNPLAVGQCTAIEVVVKDPNGYPPLRPNGSQLDWQDFELTFTAASPDAFAWSNEKHRFLCARTPTAASATVIAHYPGSQLKPNQIVAGVDVTQSVEVAMQGVQVPATTPAVSDVPNNRQNTGRLEVCHLEPWRQDTDREVHLQDKACPKPESTQPIPEPTADNK